jgi:hypothetical protein
VRLQPRLRDDVITANHGGIVIVGSHPMSVIVFELASIFEVICVKLCVGQSQFILAVSYWPGSDLFAVR